MFENRVQEVRLLKYLTRKQLAQAVDANLQQIQRIEAGIQHIRFDLARRICVVLGEPLEKVFPTSKAALARMSRRGINLDQAYEDERARDDLEKSGMDMEPATWFLKYRMRGGAKGALPISGPDKHRLDRMFQSKDPDHFLIFDSSARRYAMNPRHLMFCHLIFESESTADPVDGSETLEFYLIDQAEPFRFAVEPDAKPIEDERVGGGDAQLQDLFFYADSGTDQRLVFVDVNGERASFRPDDVSMFSALLSLVNPALEYEVFLDEAEAEE
jgi:DNA-binding XRE family transcriptional regulator